MPAQAEAEFNRPEAGPSRWRWWVSRRRNWAAQADAAVARYRRSAVAFGSLRWKGKVQPMVEGWRKKVKRESHRLRW